MKKGRSKIVGTANGASKNKSGAIGRMINLERTSFGSRTNGEFVKRIARDVVPSLLPRMTIITEMSTSPTKPRRNSTTILTFVLTF